MTTENMDKSESLATCSICGREPSEFMCRQHFVERVRALEAAIMAFNVVVVTDSNTRVRSGTRLGDAYDKLVAVLGDVP